jgi:2-deoxy-D-gluconate 3-dehydrogenase
LGLTLAEAGANIVSIQLPGDPELGALEKEVRSFGQEFQHFDCNIGDSVALRKCFTEIWTAGVAPDILLNCAGTNRHGPLENLTDEDINVVSIFIVSNYRLGFV